MTSIPAESNGLWRDRQGSKVCFNPWTHFEVNSTNGDVTMCCDVPTVLGNVNDQSILEIWKGPGYQRARQRMFELGGEKMCWADCPLLTGSKDYQSFAWYRDLDQHTKCYENALLNEQEMREGKTVLASFPRWMRFAISYRCNFKCYHCYQEDERGMDRRLPDRFIEEVRTLAQYYQFIFLFGGEPTLFPEFPALLRCGSQYPHIRFCMVSNGSLLHLHRTAVAEVNWAMVSVSLDAAREETFRLLRRSKKWGVIMENLRMLAELRKHKGFSFTLGMTLNSKNSDQIYEFVVLASGLGAVPDIGLVSNPDQSVRFNRQYLHFSQGQKDEILGQIAQVERDFPVLFPKSGLGPLRRWFASYRPAAQVARTSLLAAKRILPPTAIQLLRRLKP